MAPYRGEVWTPVLAELVAKESPQAIFGPVTTRQREVMARLAARLGAGLAADSTSMALDGGKLVATRPVYAGKLLSKVTWAKAPWMATLRPNVFRPGGAPVGSDGAGREAGGGHPRRGHEAGRASRGSRHRTPRAGGGGDRRLRRTRAQGPGELRRPRGVGQGRRRSRRRLARRGGRGLAPASVPDRPDRPHDLAEALHGLRHLGRDPAPGWHADVEGDLRRQQGSRRRRSSRSPTSGSWAICSRSRRS